MLYGFVCCCPWLVALSCCPTQKQSASNECKTTEEFVHITARLLSYLFPVAHIVAIMDPNQLSQRQHLGPISPNVLLVKDDKHAGKRGYKQDCLIDLASLTGLAPEDPAETDPEEIRQLWDSVRAFDIAAMWNNAMPVSVEPSTVSTTSEFRVLHLDSRKIRIDYTLKEVPVYGFFGTQKIGYSSLCQNCPWVDAEGTSHLASDMSYLYFHDFCRATFIEVLQYNLLRRTPLAPHFSGDDHGTNKWHVARRLNVGGDFNDTRWKMIPKLSQPGGLSAPPKRPGTGSKTLPVATAKASLAATTANATTPSAMSVDPAVCSVSDVSYWLDVPARFRSTARVQTFMLGDRLIFPYLSVFLARPGEPCISTVDRLAMAGSDALYNRFCIAAKANAGSASTLKHFGLTVGPTGKGGSDDKVLGGLNAFQLWLIKPASPPGISQTKESPKAEEWNGAHVSMLLSGTWGNELTVRMLATWVNEIHRFGAGVYANAVEKDLRVLVAE